MSFNAKTALRLALVATAAVSVTACASRPKPNFPTTAPAAPERPMTRPETSAPPAAPVTSSILPGSEQDFVINAGDRVYFDVDSYSVRGDGEPVLAAQAAWLRRYPQVIVRIEGNADERGTSEYNLALGARRANAVREYLIAQGVTGSRISTVSYGKEKPIAFGSDEGSWAKNRNAHSAIVGGARN